MLADILYRIRALFRRKSVESDLDDELRFHFERLTEKYARMGATPEQAVRKARLELGGLEQLKEECRQSWGVRIWDELRGDARHALRQMRKTPGIVMVAVLSIALGIGATTAVFSVVRAVLLDPYPYRGADRMFRTGDLFSAKAFLAWQKLDVFDGLIATDFYNMSLTGGDLPESVSAARLSANAFEFFGIPAFLGREFVSSDSPAGQEPEHAVVLSYSFWQRRYGADRNVLGKPIQLDRETYTIIGVAPPRFQWQDCDVFLPANLAFFTQPSLEIHGRLQPGMTHERAEAEALAVMKSLYPNLPATYRVRMSGLIDIVRRGSQETLILFLTAVFVLLAVGCANVSILLLARGTARQQELALRAAIGASRRRLTTQLLVESLLLTSAGGALGMWVAFGGLAALVRWLPHGTFPPEADIRVDTSVLLVSAGIIVVTGVISGLVPALRFSIPQLGELLQGLAKRTTSTAGSKRIQNVLVTAQVALTVVLLAGAGAAVRSLAELYRTNLGYDPHGVLTVTVPTLEGEYPTYEGRKAFYERVRQQVATLPDAEFVALGGFNAPFNGANYVTEVFGAPSDANRRVMTQLVSADFLAAWKIPLRQGRVWSDAENARAAHVAVINQTMANRFWPNGDAIGQKIQMPIRPGQFSLAPPGKPDWLEIIGVAGDVPVRGLREAVPLAAYVPYPLLIGDNWSLIVRTHSDPVSILRAVREQIHIAAPGQPIGPTKSSVRTGEDILRSVGWEKDQVVSSLFAMFAGLALALAAVGLYSAVSYATALRTQEFGIRMALGARKSDVIRLVLIPASRIVGAGLSVGIVLSLLFNKALAHWTAARVSDPWVLASIASILLAVAGLAAFIPARRAAKSDPVSSLRL